MSFQTHFRPEAEVDLAEAAEWYENQEVGLGGVFVEAVVKAIDALSANPMLVSRRHRRRNVRWIYPARFPYRVIDEIANDSILIVSVIHAARDDSHWRERLADS